MLLLFHGSKTLLKNKYSSIAGMKMINGRTEDCSDTTKGRCIEVVSTSHPKGNRAKGKNCAQGRSKKPTLIEGVQYHKVA
jgi:hypothetical protein